MAANPHDGALSRTRMGIVEVGLRYGQENRRGCLIGPISISALGGSGPALAQKPQLQPGKPEIHRLNRSSLQCRAGQL
jgi:hypothetical protein